VPDTAKATRDDNLFLQNSAQLTPEEALMRLAAIVDSSDDAIVSKDLNGIITSWNAGAERLFGYKTEEIVGKSVLTIIPSELQHEEPEILRRLRAGERIEHYETERIRKDGERVFVSLTISPIKNAAGKVTGASKIARDISERRRADDARFHLAAIIDSSDDAIVSKDLNGIITSWNAAAERLFGYRADEIVGKSVLTIIPPQLHGEEPEILRKLRAGERIEHYETERVRRDGQKVWVSLTISPIRDPLGKVIGASKIVRDISERKRVQEALIQSEKLAATGRMAAGIAHEINNPLEAVTNLAYLISTDSGLSESTRNYADLLLQEVGRASEIAKQSLAFYRDSGKPASFNVTDLLDNVISINRQKFELRSIEVVKDYRASAPAFGFASEVRQIIANLFLNAIDAMPEGGKIVARITQHHMNGESRLQVSIADTGTGIPQESRARLFEPFFTTKSNRGNGLGLWVSQGIAEKHGGKIRVRTSTREKKSGTVFSLFIPVKAHLSSPRAPGPSVTGATRQFANDVPHKTFRVAE
jgi:PAS domain S-box-containing protein